MSVLSVRGLHVRFGERVVLQDLCLEMGERETLGLVGASGSGKSMTALAILNLLPAGATARGHIDFAGRNLLSSSAVELQRIRGREIGIVFQEPATALNPLMTVLDQVGEVLRAHSSIRRRDARRRAADTLTRVGLSNQRSLHTRYPHELSGGQRQRAAIAMAMVLEPQLLIADEPTTALDARSQMQILLLLDELVRENGIALLFISHDLTVVAQLARRVLVMDHGRIVEEGETTKVFAQPQARHTCELLRASQLIVRSQDIGHSQTALLEVSGLVCEYGRGRSRLRAVDDVSLDVSVGESVGVVGESGAGKSTLLRALLGVGSIHAGQVRIAGQVFASPGAGPPKQLRRSMQCVLQDPAGSLDPHWRVREIIAEPLHLLDAKISRHDLRAKVAHLLERVGLTAQDADRFPHQFSGGQRQRIAIARALILEPVLVLLDEAMSALDVFTRAQILALLEELSRELRLAYLFVSHDLEVMRAITDRVYVLERGRIVESGPTAEVLSAPRHPYTAELVQAAPARLLY